MLWGPLTPLQPLPPAEPAPDQPTPANLHIHANKSLLANAAEVWCLVITHRSQNDTPAPLPLHLPG